MSHVESGPLATYNSLTDPNLAGFFTNTRLRRHLQRAGLVSRDGVVISETTYRMQWARRDNQRQTREILAEAILSKTLEVERMRQAEIRRKLEEIARMETVRRIKIDRERTMRSNTFPMLTPRTDGQSQGHSGQRSGAKSAMVVSRENQNRSSSRRGRSYHSGRRARSAGSHSTGDRTYSRDSSRKSRSNSRDSSDESLDRGQQFTRAKSSRPQDRRDRQQEFTPRKERAVSPYSIMPPELQSMVPSPPQGQKSAGARHRQRQHQRLNTAGRTREAPAQVELTPRQPVPVATNCKISMHYFGSSLRLGTDGMEAGDQIIVEQQPAGASTLTVFRDSVPRGGHFSFASRRYRSYPFSLTIYVNGQMDCRLSVCCEYKHKPGTRLGGKNGHFGIISISGSTPCYRCRLTADEDGQKRKEKKANRQKKKSEKQAKKKKVPTATLR